MATMRGLVPLLMITVLTGPAGAATLSEMRELNATQKPGTQVVCNRLTEIRVKDVAKPIPVESQMTGVVLLNEGDRMVFDMTYTQTNIGGQSPFRTEKYRLTTTLEKTRLRNEVDPQTITLSLPYARAYEAELLAILKDSTVSWDDYSLFRITTMPDYEVLPGPDTPGDNVMSCTLRAAPLP
ncbi:hypothetical protein [uncultured Cedecea sp.]|uniref:hypothetical protein n=1 Tax=uncultured Cedecea sp. TaxID=988762 RepID=UPI00262F77E5|nr:hypothetical protein [uncultured Cedecea sp.]